MHELQTCSPKSSSNQSPSRCWPASWICPIHHENNPGNHQPNNPATSLSTEMNRSFTESQDGWRWKECLVVVFVQPHSRFQNLPSACQPHVDLKVATHYTEFLFLLKTLHNKKLTVSWKVLGTLWDQLFDYCGIQHFFISSYFERTISEEICQANRVLSEAVVWCFSHSLSHWTLMQRPFFYCSV